MKVASQTGTGEETSQRLLVSPLEQTLDAAVESERYRVAVARRARDRAGELAPVSQHPQASLAARDGLPARSGERAEAAPLGQSPAAEVSGSVRVCALAFALLALGTAFLLPVSPAPPPQAFTGELGARATRPLNPSLERAGALHGSSADIAKDGAVRELPQQVDAEPKSRSSMLLPSTARGSAAAAPSRPEPPRSSLAATAQHAQAEAGHVATSKRATVVTVDDLFGVGGNEPLPPEALEAPASASPPASPHPARTAKPAHRAPASSSLFYQRLPF